MTTTAFNQQIVKISNKFYSVETVEDRDGGSYTAYIPCTATGGKVDRCSVCGGHDDHTRGLGCGL